MLKYIIIAEPTGAEVALFCLAPTKHLDLALMAQGHRPGRKVVAAGFVDFTYRAPAPGQGCELVAITHGASDSLNLAPREHDARFLTVFARQTAEVAAASIMSTAATS